MKKIIRLLAALMALLMLCVPALAETTEATTSPDDVLATVNGQNVTRAQFDGYYASLEGYYAQYYDVTDPEIVSLLKEFAMETAIQYAIMDQKIVELGLELPARTGRPWWPTAWPTMASPPIPPRKSAPR